MLMAASGRLRDGKEIAVPRPAFVRDLLMKELDKTQIGALLREFKLVGGADQTPPHGLLPLQAVDISN
jgi:oleate hydratase